MLEHTGVIGTGNDTTSSSSGTENGIIEESRSNKRLIIGMHLDVGLVAVGLRINLLFV
jgi:hypothetical protein